jgi:hypothetical protein
VFEYVEDNLESTIERAVKEHKRPSEMKIKVIVQAIVELYVPASSWIERATFPQNCASRPQTRKCTPFQKWENKNL